MSRCNGKRNERNARGNCPERRERNENFPDPAHGVARFRGGSPKIRRRFSRREIRTVPFSLFRRRKHVVYAHRNAFTYRGRRSPRRFAQISTPRRRPNGPGSSVPPGRGGGVARENRKEMRRGPSRKGRETPRGLFSAADAIH